MPLTLNFLDLNSYVLLASLRGLTGIGLSLNVTIVDYGMGNIFSVSRAFEYCGGRVRVTSDPAEIIAADKLVLPGVGAFGQGMRELNERGLRQPICDFVMSARGPFLGICLGMQMLFECSEESEGTVGLALLKGRVRRIPNLGFNQEKVRVPHIGWSRLNWHDSRADGEQLKLNSLNEAVAPDAYFVHSYMVVPESRDLIAASVNYHGMEIAAVVAHKKIVGMQFHPEKSGPYGLAMIRKFLHEMAGT